jgi:hypothetical protein
VAAEDTGNSNETGEGALQLTIDTAPVAVDDSGYSVTAGNTLSVTTTTAGVLANDTDADGDTLTAALVSPADHGTVYLYPDGEFTYVSNPDYAGVDTFTYSAWDGWQWSNVAKVTIKVNAPSGSSPVGVVQPDPGCSCLCRYVSDAPTDEKDWAGLDEQPIGQQLIDINLQIANLTETIKTLHPTIIPNAYAYMNDLLAQQAKLQASFDAQVVEILNKTAIGKATFDYLAKNQASIQVFSCDYIETTSTNTKTGAFSISKGLPGYTNYGKPNKIYISISANTTAVDFAATLIHECTHTKGEGKEFDSRIADITFYSQYEAATGQRCMYESYINKKIVTGSFGNWKPDPDALDKYLKSLGYGDPNIKSKYRPVNPIQMKFK